ncbi:MAG: SRPBCC family protein, partial [Acidimicrobiales bacterium]|nr:SRPBCC family protein [Acidimicrobiales bacterium]
MKATGSTGALVAPVLPDGTPLASLVDVEARTASLRLLTDPDVYRAEQEYLFGRSWNLVAHDSELPEPGDFVVRQIAGDSVVVTRDGGGEVHVLLNVAGGRGTQVCRAEVGNLYENGLHEQCLDLKQARVSLYAGLVYANWCSDSPPLDEFLGDFAFYLDTMYRRSKNGLEVAGAPQRFRIPANWKIPSEQFNGADGYHVATLHRTLVERMLPGADAPAIHAALRGLLFGVDIGSRLGHGVRTVARSTSMRTSLVAFDDTHEVDLSLGLMASLAKDPPDGTPPALVHELRTHLSDDQLKLLA